MKMTEMKRDAAHVNGQMKVAGDRLVAMSPMVMYVPTRWEARKLLFFGESTFVFGSFMLTSGDKYAVSNANCVLETNPSETERVMIDGVEHYAFQYEKGDAVISNLNPAVDANILFIVYDEMLQKGKVPVYFDVTDLYDIFRTSKKHAGKNVSSISIQHVLISAVVRTAKDFSKYFRLTSTKTNHKTAGFISMKSPLYSGTNNSSRLTGSHFDDKLTTALSTSVSEEEVIESYLRK